MTPCYRISDPRQPVPPWGGEQRHFHPAERHRVTTDLRLLRQTGVPLNGINPQGCARYLRWLNEKGVKDAGSTGGDLHPVRMD
jgi:hypothetical protein